MSELSYHIAEIVDVQKQGDAILFPRKIVGGDLVRADIYAVSLQIGGETVTTKVRVEQNDPEGKEVKLHLPLPSNHTMVEAFRLCFEDIMAHLEKPKLIGNGQGVNSVPDKVNGETGIDVRVMDYLTYIIGTHTFPQIVMAAEEIPLKPHHRNSTHLTSDAVTSYRFLHPESTEIARYLRHKFSPHA